MTSRADRRRAQKGARGGAKRPATIADLAARVERARAPGLGRSAEARGRRMLAAYLQTAAAHGLPLSRVVADLAEGAVTLRLGEVARDSLMQAPPPAVANAACADGCAFCCILTEGDGGLITETEARRLHAALTPLAGQPEGRAWHAAACPALDPETRSCRVYEARPTICRSFLSVDAAACETNANGGEAEGAGLLGSHVDYLAVQALARDLLKGIARVPTYAMARVAAGAVEGESLDDTLDGARHGSNVLERTCRDAAKAGGA
ncbi:MULTISPECIES: YkgJ family cysteine cluster protein [Paracoccaceae]|uniref:Fe-S oxidoreductase n=1 Tax=Marinibacterium profundimaris TaxID=1679460 RepID=A0A225NC97_9RHOB|nr:YkgJ family cysteine cluster protein [Marinibacterium profundimaris]OWU68698.1 hypothetical protein ATO3_23395 [Marinibacterium profundimaris]